MSRFQTDEEYEGADGFAKNKSADSKNLIKVWIMVRKDNQIPDFDAVTDVKYFLEGFDEEKNDIEALCEKITDQSGMFVDDLLALRDQDMTLARPAIFAPLRAFKKAVYNYFEKSGQLDRLKKATQQVICSCRNVYDHEIKAALEKGKTDLESLMRFTSAGTGCSTCRGTLQGLIDTFIRNNLKK